ncbi:alpha-galactosidase [Leifsonia aquatica]|uniref:alpha-galactosidase n=1 Tax=Leifsonia aquatica TaxID=144185 RepID=UPI00046ACB70|nr:alpha-galactosidase [Leifsonia aquatica]
MAISFDAELDVFTLHTANTTYAFQVRDDRRLLHLYWGAGRLNAADLPRDEQVFSHHHEESVRVERHREEYAAQGGYFFDEPGIAVAYADGVRDCAVRYDSHSITSEGGRDELAVVLIDAQYGLELTLHYRLYAGLDIVDRWASVTNRGLAAVVATSLKSATFYPAEGRGHRLAHLSGRWGAEHRIERTPLTQSRTVLESRHGISGHDNNPWFAIDRGGAATETSGDVWFGALHWSGNWRITVEQDRWDQVRVTGGYNDFDFALTLEPGATHTTPIFTGGFTTDGFGSASRMLHRYQRSWLAPALKAATPRPVIFNSWEVFWFDINAEQQLALAEQAAAVGAEVFVVDDGWFVGRDDDHGGLGDWVVDPRKFPEGLAPLARHVESLGMAFGLWVEPEMVSPNSRLAAEHPDWIIGFPTREGTLVRNQLVLNLALDEVREWMFSWLDELIGNVGIGYLKWDMNRYLTEAGFLTGDQDDRIWVAYVENLYDVFRRLQAKHPEVLFENCASGGGRVDFGMAAVSDLVSRSDNGDALDILKLHEGYTQAYAPITAGGGIGEVPNGINGRTAPLTFRAHAGMLGAFHISVNLFTMTPEQLAELTGFVELYKSIRSIVHLGELHRLVSAWENPYAAYQYVSEDRSQAVVLAFGQFLQFQFIVPRLRLRGLDEDALYEVDGYKPMSGAALMGLGLPLELHGDYDSRVIRVTRSAPGQSR